MNLLASLILYVVGVWGAQHIPISKGPALLEIGAIITMTSIHWGGTAVNITERSPSIPTDASTAHGSAFQPSGNAAPPSIPTGANTAHGGAFQSSGAITHCNPPNPTMTLAAKMSENPPYPNLTFSATTRPGIISPLYPNLTASAGIWTAYEGPTSGRGPTFGRAISASNSQTPISPGAQVIYSGASYRVGFSFGNAIFSFFSVLFMFTDV